MRDWGGCGYTFPNKLSENSFCRTGWTELTRIAALQFAIPLGARDKNVQASGRPTEVVTFGPSIDAIWYHAAEVTPFMVAEYQRAAIKSEFPYWGPTLWQYVSNSASSRRIAEIFSAPVAGMREGPQIRRSLSLSKTVAPVHVNDIKR
jgi:hypothetical protein